MGSAPSNFTNICCNEKSTKQKPAKRKWAEPSEIPPELNLPISAFDKTMLDEELKYKEIYKNFTFETTKQLFDKSNTSNNIYIARLIDVYDGDTITVALKTDNLINKYTIRVYGVDCPEMRDMANRFKAYSARKFTLNYLSNGAFDGMDIYETRKFIEQSLGNNIHLVKIETLGYDKYGRVLANVEPFNNFNPNSNLTEELVKNGHGNRYSGGTKQ